MQDAGHYPSDPHMVRDAACRAARTGMRLQWQPKAKPASREVGCSAARPATAVVAHETAVSAANGGINTVLPRVCTAP